MMLHLFNRVSEMKSSSFQVNKEVDDSKSTRDKLAISAFVFESLSHTSSVRAELSGTAADLNLIGSKHEHVCGYCAA